MKIQLKRSNILDAGKAKEPQPAQLDYGELAVNYNVTDPTIFLKASDDSIVTIASSDAGVQDLQAVCDTGNTTTTGLNAGGAVLVNRASATDYLFEGQLADVRQFVVLADGSTLIATDSNGANAKIDLDANGTGTFEGEIRSNSSIACGTAGADNFKVNENGNITAGSISGSSTLDITGACTLSGLNYPTADGQAGYVIVTDGSGALTFAANSAGSVTQVDTGTGLTGGPITDTGTISLDAAVGELNDVTITDVADNQILQYDDANSIWVNASLPSSAVPTLQDVCDQGAVTTTDLTVGGDTSLQGLTALAADFGAAVKLRKDDAGANETALKIQTQVDGATTTTASIRYNGEFTAVTYNLAALPALETAPV